MDPTKLTLLKGLDVPRGQGDPDLVDLGGTGTTGLVEFVLGVVHVDLFLVFCRVVGDLAIQTRE